MVIKTAEQTFNFRVIAHDAYGNIRLQSGNTEYIYSKFLNRLVLTGVGSWPVVEMY